MHEGKVRTCSRQVLQERLAIGTVTRGKRRLSATSHPLRGRILRRTGTNTQEGGLSIIHINKKHTYRGAVVGYGNLGTRHAEVMSGLEPLRLVAVADQLAEARARAAQDFPGVTLYEDPAEMFRTEDLDIVAIVTHASGHAPLSLLAADHGAHVVCAKPMAAAKPVSPASPSATTPRVASIASTSRPRASSYCGA